MSNTTPTREELEREYGTLPPEQAVTPAQLADALAESEAG